MNEPHLDTVLIVSNDEVYSHSLIGELQDLGINVVGPVSRANMALALAAQTPPDLAIVAQPLTGRRDAEELARELHATWGVRSLVLGAALADGGAEAGERPWLPGPDELTHLRAILDRLS
jgi:DNA-binding NarL/FixJ family response regulator